MSITKVDRSTQLEAKIRRLADKCLDVLHGGNYSKGEQRDRMDRLRGLVAMVKQGPLSVDLAHRCHTELRAEIIDLARIGCTDSAVGEFFNQIANYLGTELSARDWGSV